MDAPSRCLLAIGHLPNQLPLSLAVVRLAPPLFTVFADRSHPKLSTSSVWSQVTMACISCGVLLALAGMLLAAGGVVGQPFAPGTGFLPGGVTTQSVCCACEPRIHLKTITVSR